MAPDFYELLGVTESAGESEVKKAYRRLALQHHPDKNPGSKHAEEQFREIAEAYATLSDSIKRRQYDHVRCKTPASDHRSHQTPGSTTGSDFACWGRAPGDGPDNAFTKRRPSSSFGDAWSGTFADEQQRRSSLPGSVRPISSSVGVGVGNHATRHFSLGEALGLFDAMFAGRNPFSDFTDGFGTPSCSSRLNTSGSVGSVGSVGSGPSWDVKVTKVKKVDGSLFIERRDSRIGQSTCSCFGDDENSYTSFRGSRGFRSETPLRQPGQPRSSGAGIGWADFPVRRGSTPTNRARSSGSRPQLTAALSLTDSRLAMKISPHQLPAAGCVGGGGGGIGRGSWPDAGGGCGLGNMGSRGSFVGWSSN